MENDLIKLDRNKFFNTYTSVNNLQDLETITDISKIDFTELLGRDLTSSEKTHYSDCYKHKTIPTIISIIVQDFIEHRINE